MDPSTLKWLNKVHTNSTRIAKLRRYQTEGTLFTDYKAQWPNELRFKMNRLYTRWNIQVVVDTFPQLFKQLYGDNISSCKYFADLDIDEICKHAPELGIELQGIPELIGQFHAIFERIVFCSDKLQNELAKVWNELSDYGLVLDNVLMIYHGYITVGNQIKVDFVRDFVARLEDVNEIAQMRTEAMFIANEQFSSSAKYSLQGFEEDMVIMSEEELQFYIFDHKLVPDVVKLSTEEKYTLFKELGIKGDKLALMHQTDPVSKYLGLKIGDVAKFPRNFSYLDIPIPCQLGYRVVIP